jgi:WD40 repeat protein
MLRRSCLTLVVLITSVQVLQTFAGEPVNDVSEPLPLHAIARMGTYRFFHGPQIRHAVLSPDGGIIASASDEALWYEGENTKYFGDKLLVLWDSSTGKPLRKVQLPQTPVLDFAFSPNSKQLAVRFGREKWDRGIAVVDTESGKIVKRLVADEDLGLVRFTSNGKSLVLSEDYGERLAQWDIESGKRIRSWQRPSKQSGWLKEREYVCDGMLSPDSRFLAWLVDLPPDYSKIKITSDALVVVPPHIASPTALLMVDAEHSKLAYRKEFSADCLKRFAFFADGRRFMTGGDKLSAYDTANGKHLFDLNASSPYKFALSADSRFAVTMTGESQVSLWNLESKVGHKLLPGMIPVDLANFSADGKSLLLVTRRTLRVFDTTSGKERLSLGHRSPVTPRFSADGRTLTTTCYELRRTWDVSQRNAPKLLDEKPRNAWEGMCGHPVVTHCIDGPYFVTNPGELQLRLYERATGKFVRDLEGYPYPIFGMFSQDSIRLLIWHGAIDEAFDGFRLYDVRTGKKTGQIPTPDRAGYYPAISADGRFIAWADYSNVVHLHDGTSGKLIRRLYSRNLAKSECNDASIVFTPDGSHVIVTTYNCDSFRKQDGDKWLTFPTRVFRVADGQEVSRFYTNLQTTTRAMPLSCSAVSPDGQILAVAEKDSPTIRVIKVASGKVLAEYNGHREGIHGLAFSPDGRVLASGGDDTLTILWNVPPSP